MRTVQHAVYAKIERGGALSEDDFQVAVIEGGRVPPRRPLQRWLSSRPLALRPIYWEISSDAYTSFKMGCEKELGKEAFGVRRYVPVE